MYGWRQIIIAAYLLELVVVSTAYGEWTHESNSTHKYMFVSLLSSEQALNKAFL